MSQCPRCGVEFSCGVADRPAAQDGGETSCWCMGLPALPAAVGEDGMRPSATGQAACLCRNCLLAALAQASHGKETH